MWCLTGRLLLDGYRFDPANPNTFTNSTSITIFDDLGNPTIATMYFIKTQLLQRMTPRTNMTHVLSPTTRSSRLISPVC